MRIGFPFTRSLGTVLCRTVPFRASTHDVRNIRDAVDKMKTPKGFGTNIISSYFLKLAMSYIENSLAYILNTSLKSSRFPDDWKTAKVTPIFKDSEKSDKSNYLPILVLLVIFGLFEKLVFNQLYQYLDHNGLLSPHQSGFRRLHSTITCLLKPSAHSRFLSLRHAIFVFSSCRTQQTFIVARGNF